MYLLNSHRVTHPIVLSRLYYYATIGYVGGGFNKGIHNVLEAAVYGKPVIIGPVYYKFREAIQLVETGGAFSVNNAEELTTKLSELLTDESKYQQSAVAAGKYVADNKGASNMIMKYIQEKRLLTN
ncbi:MAG: glycosyltransferase [Chryseobacterium sp.]|nr:MAG: glycosyltransferase [Chryseobacterium sp.]